MKIKDVISNENIDFQGAPLSYFLIGLLSAFENRFQAVADSAMKEISWKQFFAIICIDMCKLIVHFHNMYEALFNEVDDLYMNIDSTRERYIQCCQDDNISPENFIMPHNSAPYAFANQSYAKNYGIMASLANTPEKAAAVYKANGVKFLMIQTNIIKNIFTIY